MASDSMKCWSNPMDEYKVLKKKSSAFLDAAYKNETAVDSQGQEHLLKNCNIADVAFVAGLWRVQDKFPYEITPVRDRQFVLWEKLPHQEKTKFDFYSASTVGVNAYGYFVDKKPNFIVAKYDTVDGAFWAYGTTIESARAFLGVKLYDEYQDIIHAVAHRKSANSK